MSAVFHKITSDPYSQFKLDCEQVSRKIGDLKGRTRLLTSKNRSQFETSLSQIQFSVMDLSEKVASLPTLKTNVNCRQMIATLNKRIGEVHSLMNQSERETMLDAAVKGGICGASAAVLSLAEEKFNAVSAIPRSSLKFVPYLKKIPISEFEKKYGKFIKLDLRKLKSLPREEAIRLIETAAGDWPGMGQFILGLAETAVGGALLMFPATAPAGLVLVGDGVGRVVGAIVDNGVAAFTPQKPQPPSYDPLWDPKYPGRGNR